MTNARRNDRRLNFTPVLIGRTALLSTCASFAIVGVANAQQAAPNTNQNNGTAVEEVIVTATKRGAESLQKVPIAISAETQATLESKGATEFADFARSVPSLSFVDAGPGAKTYIIRGVNSTGAGVATVGQYVDDILITGDLRQPDLRLYDVQRVEVLRGPQGTLYGSGSLSGTIRTITNQPDPTRFGLDVVGRLSDTQHGGVNGEGAVTLNAPIVADKLALRATVYEDDESGFIDNVRLGTHHVNKEHTYGGRAALLWQLDDATSITANALYQDTTTDGRNIITTTGSAAGKYKTDQWVHDPFVDRFKIFNVTVKHDFGLADFVLSSSYFDRSVDNKFDSTPFDLSFGPTFFTGVVGLSTYRGLTDQADTSKLFTNEARVSSKFGGRFEAVVGVFQQQIKTTFDTLVATSNLAGYLNEPVEPIFGEHQAHQTDQYALFGELSYKITDELTALVGARAFRADEKDDRASTYPFGGFAPPSVSPTVKSTAKKITPKFYLAWQPDDDHLYYATISEGFRIGGGNQNNVVPLPVEDQTYQPDSLWNYELGAKMSFLERRLLVNASVYRMDWSNIQVSDYTDDSNAFVFISNAGAARVYGAELEADARPTPELSIGGSLAYVNAKLTEDQPSTNAAFAGRSGDRFPNVPRWSGSAFAQYTHDLGGGLQVLARADYSYTGHQGTQFSPLNPLYNTIKAYDLLNLRAGLRTETWEAALYVRNAFDKYAAVNILEEASDLTPRAIVPVRPRTVGVEVRYHY